MKLSLKLIESDSAISSKILESIKPLMDQAFKKALPRIKIRISEEMKKALMSEPEYQSLISGQLKYEFGIPVQQKVNNIIDLWVSNISTTYKGVRAGTRGLVGGLSLDMIKSSYDDVLGSDSAIVVDSLSGVVLPWLEWLLLYGNKIVIRDYRVQFGSNSRSRTGMAIMIESKGSNWRVPTQFAGTISNNWVTRAMDKLDDKILDILEQELERSI